MGRFPETSTDATLPQFVSSDLLKLYGHFFAMVSSVT